MYWTVYSNRKIVVEVACSSYVIPCNVCSCLLHLVSVMANKMRKKRSLWQKSTFLSSNLDECYTASVENSNNIFSRNTINSYESLFCFVIESSCVSFYTIVYEYVIIRYAERQCWKSHSQTFLNRTMLTAVQTAIQTANPIERKKSIGFEQNSTAIVCVSYWHENRKKFGDSWNGVHINWHGLSSSR